MKEKEPSIRLLDCWRLLIVKLPVSIAVEYPSPMPEMAPLQFCVKGKLILSSGLVSKLIISQYLHYFHLKYILHFLDSMNNQQVSYMYR